MTIEATAPNNEETSESEAQVDKELSDKPAADENGAGDLADEKRVRRVLNKIQERSNEMAAYVRKQMLEDAKAKVGQNPLVSLLMAIGLGFIFGFLLRGLGRRDG